MPSDPGAGLVFAVVFLGALAGLLYLLARLEGSGDKTTTTAVMGRHVRDRSG